MFINETKIDLEFNAKASKNIAGKGTFILLIVAAVFTAIIGIVNLVTELRSPSEEGTDLYFSIFILVLSFICASFVVFYKPIMKLVLKKMTHGKETTNKYTFNEDGYVVETVMTDGTTSTAQGGYDGFTQAKEYKDMWLLYINKATVFALSKDGMVEGDAVDLTIFLAKTLGSRYKVCYKTK